MTQTLSLTNHAADLGLNYLQDRLYVVRTLVPPGYEAYFRKRAQYRSVHSSTAIEGNKLGSEQVSQVLSDDVEASSPDEMEVKNLDEAYELIQQIASDPSVRIDEGLVRTMNSIMLRGLPSAEARSRGRYRLGPSLIVNSRTGDVRYRPPQPEWVASLMENFLKEVQRWLDDKIYPGPAVAALAHFGLISIHPFEDGNGRTARLLADMILQKTGWSGEGMLSVSEAILQRQDDYYEALRSTQGDDFLAEVDATEFVRFHTRALSTAAITLEGTVIQFNRRRHAFATQAKRLLNARQALALMCMMDVAPLSTSTFAEMTGASQSSALSDLTEMVELGIAEKVGRSRNTRYRINPEFRRSIELELGRLGQAKRGPAVQMPS